MSKEVVDVVDLGYLGIEKDFPENCLPSIQKEDKSVFITRRKRLQLYPFKK